MHDIDDQLDPSVAGFVKPSREINGKTLACFGPGMKVLFQQSTVTADETRRNSGIWVSVALLYLLTLDPKEARRIAFQREEFREKALAWYDSAGLAENDAIKLADEILTQAEQTKVEVNSSGGTDPKNA